jgi:hypothetical protein
MSPPDFSLPTAGFFPLRTMHIIISSFVQAELLQISPAIPELFECPLLEKTINKLLRQIDHSNYLLVFIAI